MEILYFALLLAVIQLEVYAFMVGRARGAHKIEAPAMSGHPVFDRRFRIHQNTVEQLVILIPSALLFGNYVSVRWAAGLVGVFIVARIVYMVDYMKDPVARARGFLIGLLATAVMALGALWGVGSVLLR